MFLPPNTVSLLQPLNQGIIKDIKATYTCLTFRKIRAALGANPDCNIVDLGTSLVVQWLRICLPMQGTRVPSLVQEDPTCCRATKPVHHNY